jgi:LPS-assembly protein
MSKSIKRVIIFVSVFLSAMSNIFAKEVYIAADNLEYIKNCSKINVSNNVILNWADKKLYADYAEFIINKKIMNAHGHIKLEEGNTTIYADSISYKYDDETGNIREIFAYSAPMFIRAESINRHGSDIFTIKNIKFSNCDLDNPHTYFKSKCGRLVLNKRITIYNAIFYVGKVPVFYLPILTRSLRGRNGLGSNLRFKIEPGLISSNQLILKTAISCSLAKFSRGKFIYDYLAERGDGYGGEIKYLTNKAIGNIYIYTIKDLVDKKKRWALMFNHFYKLNNLWTLRSKSKFMNDRIFNNYYNQNNRDKDTNRLVSYASIARSGCNNNLIVDFRYNSDYDVLAETYKTSSIKIPSVHLDFFNKNFFCGIIYRSEFRYNNEYAQHSNGNYFYRNTSLLKYMLIKNFKLVKKTTLTPTLEVVGNWYNKDRFGNFCNTFFAQYGGTLNLRFRIANWINSNVKYSYRARTRGNSFYTDTSANDYGIGTNNIVFSNFVYIGDSTTIRNSVAYNLLNFRLNTLHCWTPFITEVIWNPKHLVVYVRESQFVDVCKFNSFQVDIRVGKLNKSYLNFSAFYQHYNDWVLSHRSNKINNIFGFGVWLTPKWRLDYNIRSTFLTDLSIVAIDEHEFRVYRDLHCYNLTLKCRMLRNFNWHIGFKFDVKTNMPFGESKDNFCHDNDKNEEIFYT